eukprot:11080039-Lingulodinium_polyedra.AAC.1
MKDERNKRVQMTRAACSRMGRFWWTGAPKRLKRLVYIAYVQSTMLTAAEALPLTERDMRRYGTVMIGHLRAMMA